MGKQVQPAPQFSGPLLTVPFFQGNLKIEMSIVMGSNNG